MTILRRFECALEATKAAVVAQYKKIPTYPAKAMQRISGYQFFNTCEYTLIELCNDPDHVAANFREYINGFSSNVQEIFKELKILGESAETGITVHMFMRHGSDDYVYRGIVTLAGEVYKEIEPDKNGNLREVYKFPLQFRSTAEHKASEAKNAEVEQELEKRAESMDLESLFAANEKILDKINANEELGKVRTKSSMTKTKRDHVVAAYVIARAKGKCQLCGESVDLEDLHKPSRLICHHEPPLKEEGGRDDKLHAVALCANCHDRRHSKKLSKAALETYIRIISLEIKDSEERIKRELQG